MNILFGKYETWDRRIPSDDKKHRDINIALGSDQIFVKRNKQIYLANISRNRTYCHNYYDSHKADDSGK